jgi:predicted lactoylglutathione lyase
MRRRVSEIAGTSSSRNRVFETNGNIADAAKTTEVLVALSCETREEVEKIAGAAMAAGATEAKPPQDYGFMTVRSLNDLDGHIWEYMWMDPAHAQG